MGSLVVGGQIKLTEGDDNGQDGLVAAQLKCAMQSLLN